MKSIQFLKFNIGIIIFIVPLMTIFSQQNLSATDIVKKEDDKYN
ncbi:hypothetical protein V8G69_10400 [Gaetbulibacter sp. M235]